MATVARSKENLMKCICIRCPTYKWACKLKSMPKNVINMLKGDISGLDHAETMFCAFEKSNCITEPVRCICPTCKVYKENILSSTFFCLRTGGK